jgi:hypothetical protein
MYLFQVPQLETVREFFDRISKLFAQMDLATKHGKALEHLRERVIGLYGIEEMIVREPGSERDSPEIKISLVTSRPQSLEEQYLIRRILDEVNRRFGTSIQAAIH